MLPDSMRHRYDVLEELGSGEWGTVYKVRDIKTGSIYALKDVIMKKKEGVALIAHEFRILSYLEHPNIVRVYNIEQDNSNRIFYTMECVDGASIRDYFKDLRLDHETIQAIVIQICMALAYIHHQGIIHLDLKPENILLQFKDGKYTPKVSDFGLSEFIKTGKKYGDGIPMIKGTYPYMSPEAISGRKVDHQSDLYSLGVILYEWLTGFNPFALNTVTAIMSAHLSLKPLAPKEVNPSVDENISRLTMQLLEKEPSFRPASADEVILKIRDEQHISEYSPPLSAGRFIDRSVDLDELRKTFAEAESGKSIFTIVQGPKGIGKTRFLNHIRADIQLSGYTLIEVESDDLELVDVNYFQLLQDQMNMILSLKDKNFWRNLYREAQQEKEYVTPFTTQHSRVFQKYAHRFLMYLKEVIAVSKTRALVIIFKNFHTQKVIPWQFLTRIAGMTNDSEFKGIPLVWIIETRDPIQINTCENQSQRFMRIIRLKNFRRSQTADLLGSLFNIVPFPDYLTEKIHALTGGNPEIINVVARSLSQAGIVEWKEMGWRINHSKTEKILLGNKVEKFFHSLIKQMPKDVLMILKHSALWSRPFNFRELFLTLPDYPYRELSVQKAVLAGYLEKLQMDTGVCYKLSHPAMRESLLTTFDEDELIGYHKILVEYLLDVNPKEPEYIAYHSVQAREFASAKKWALVATREFQASGRHHDAVKLFNHVLINLTDDIEDLSDLYFELSRSYFRLHQYTHAKEAIDKTDGYIDHHQRTIRAKVEYMLLKGSIELRLKRYSDAADIFQRAMEVLNEDISMENKLRLLGYLAYALLWSGRATEAIHRIEVSLGTANVELYPQLVGRLYAALANAYYVQRNFKAARKAQSESIRYGEITEKKINLVDRYIMMGKIYHQLGNFRKALDSYGKVIEQARQSQDPYNLALALSLFSALKIDIDEPENIESLLREALDISEKWQYPTISASCLLTLSKTLISKGQLKKAVEHLNQAEFLMENFDDFSLISQILINRSKIQIRTGEWSKSLKGYISLKKLSETKGNDIYKAYAHLFIANVYKHQKEWDHAIRNLNESTKILKQMDITLPDCEILRAEIGLGQKDIRGALKTAKTALEISSRKDLSHSQGYAHRVLALIYHKQGEFEKARKHFIEALQAFESRQEVFELALTHMHFGELYQTTADIEKANNQLEKAKDLFNHLGVDYYVTQVDNIMELTKENVSITPLIDPVLIAFERLTSIINSITTPDQLLEEILDVAIRFVNAERGMIVLINPNSDEPEIRAVKNLDDMTSKDANLISRTVLMRAQKTDSAVVTGDAPSDPRFSTVKSVRAYNILSLICVPLKLRDEAMGVIYVDSRRISNLFSERDRRFMQAFADLAAVMIDRSNLYKAQEEEKAELRQEIEGRYRFDRIIGKSKAMRNVFQRLESVIRTDVAVLITGSSGTGKDLAACAIHYNGARRNHRFIAINCAAIPETLIESELFGHCRGAFTDAKTDKPGRFEVADGGTVFLDEIGELNPHIQVKLLRVIEMKEVTRLGEDIPRKVDVRIIAATNRDLRKAIESGEFREDFYYRLRVAQINMPDLKDRREDIPMLSNHFLRHSKSCEDNNFKGFSPRAMNTLVNYYWPGNVRELQNVIESAIVFGQPPLIQMNDLPLDIFHKEDADNLELSSGKSCSLEVMEKKHIESVLRIFNGNKTQCSKILGITRPTLDRKIKKYRIIIE